MKHTLSLGLLLTLSSTFGCAPPDDAPPHDSQPLALGCTYGTLWGVASSNLGAPSASCRADDALEGCDLWVYELAWSADTSCRPFVTALRRVTRTPGTGEIDARMTLGGDTGPSQFRDTAVSPGAVARFATETRSWSAAEFYGFSVSASAAAASIPAVARTLTRGDVQLRTVPSPSGGVTTLQLTRGGVATDVGALVAQFALRHRSFGVTPDNLANVSFFTGDFAVQARVAQPRARVYAALASHNEADPDQARCRAAQSSAAAYRANRDLTIELANHVVAAEAAWDLQSDWLYAQDGLLWDDVAFRAAHGGMMTLGYLDQLAPGRIVVEPHTHDDDVSVQPHSYADVVGWLRRAGATRGADAGVVGGFNWSRDVSAFAAPIAPESPAWSWATPWQARTLTFGALGYHDPTGYSDVRLDGVWRPSGDGTDDHSDASDPFFQHGPAAPLVFVGTGSRNLDALRALLQKLAGAELRPGRLYPAQIMFDQCALATTGPTSPSTLRANLLSLRAEVNRGRLVWAPYPVLAEDWELVYGSAPSCSDPDPADAHACPAF
jgi:hypothetical protein